MKGCSKGDMFHIPAARQPYARDTVPLLAVVTSAMSAGPRPMKNTVIKRRAVDRIA